MGSLLRSFTYPRNAFSKTASESAIKTHETIARARSGALFDKDEAFNDAQTFLGVVGREDGEPVVTKLGEVYERAYSSDSTPAWQWLVTRSMWRFGVPNGTGMHINEAASELDLSFNFFDLMTRLIWGLGAERAPANSLYFDELMSILDDDTMWGMDHGELLQVVRDRRGNGTVPPPSSHNHRRLLGNLEDEYQIGRDYMNTVFRKAFGQSGLFELTLDDADTPVGICLARDMPIKLFHRLRYVLDNPVAWTPTTHVSAGGLPL